MSIANSSLLVRPLLLALWLGAAAAPVRAEPVIAPVGDPTSNSSVYSNQYNLVTWSFATAWTGISISAALFTVATAPRTGDAFLMTQVGPGTTQAAHQIAHTSFSFAAATSPPTYVDLFSGLDLGPGTYYLVFADADNAAADSAILLGPGVTYSLAAGVTIGTPQFSLAEDAYAPASTWSNSGFGNRLFRVNGTAVPEPATLALLGAALAGLGFMRRRAV